MTTEPITVYGRLQIAEARVAELEGQLAGSADHHLRQQQERQQKIEQLRQDLENSERLSERRRAANEHYEGVLTEVAREFGEPCERCNGDLAGCLDGPPSGCWGGFCLPPEVR